MRSLSVVVPCFDVAPYVPALLYGLARNAAPGVEFLLVDDGSTDGTSALLAAGVDRVPGGRLISHPANRGLSAARNTGLAASRGEYLAFLDGDDVLAPGSLGPLLAAAERFGADFLRTDHVQVTGRKRTVHHVAHALRNTVCPPRTGIGPVGRRSSVDSPYAWSGIYHRRLAERGLLQFDEDLRTAEDRPWIWRLHLRAASFAVIGWRGVRYRRDVAGSLSRTGDTRQFDVVPAFERIVAACAADADAARLLPKAIRSYAAIACHHLKQLDRLPEGIRPRFRAALAGSFAGLPAAPLESVLAGLDPERARVLRGLAEGESRLGISA